MGTDMPTNMHNNQFEKTFDRFNRRDSIQIRSVCNILSVMLKFEC